MPLNADQLDAFWQVAQTGSYHRAADALHVSQPAVTQRIQALESALGKRLFVRAGKGVNLSASGRMLVRHCLTRRNAEEAFLQEMAGEGGLVGRLAIAAGTAEGQAWVLPVLADLGRLHPHLELSLRLDDQLDPIAVLESCQADAVLGDFPVRRRGLKSSRLGEVPFGLVAGRMLAANWPQSPDAALLKSSQAIDFAPTDRITLDQLAACLPGEDFADLRRHYVNQTQAILAWVLAGGGFSALPLPLAAPFLADGRLIRLHPEVTTSRTLYWVHPDGPPHPALAALQADVKRLIDKNLQSI